MLNFIIGLFCGMWIFKVYSEYQAKERHKAMLQKAIDEFKRFTKADKGPS